MTDSEGRLLTVQPLIAYGEGFVQGGDLLEAVPQCAKMEFFFARRVHVTTPHHTPAQPVGCTRAQSTRTSTQEQPRSSHCTSHGTA